jgi:hypothetical protein
MHQFNGTNEGTLITICSTESSAGSKDHEANHNMRHLLFIPSWFIVIIGNHCSLYMLQKTTNTTYLNELMFFGMFLIWFCNHLTIFFEEMAADIFSLPNNIS